MLSPKIAHILGEMESYSASHANAWSIPREEAQFLHALLKSLRPKTILEIGTSTGYSTIWFALAARAFGGKVFTIEHDPAKIKIAKENFRKAGAGKTIRILGGDANKILGNRGKLKIGGRRGAMIDFIFLDGVKSEYLQQFKWVHPHLRRGGVVAADNAGDFAAQMKDYLKFVRTNKKLHTVFVPIGNGVELTQKL